MVTTYEAVEVLYRNRHNLPSDLIRTLQAIWICRSAAYYQGPGEKFWEDFDWSIHNVGQCEAEDSRIPGVCPGCNTELPEGHQDWFCQDCMTAASEVF